MVFEVDGADGREGVRREEGRGEEVGLEGAEVKYGGGV